MTVMHRFELLGLARSTAYHLPEEFKPYKDEIETKNCIDRIHYKESSYGVRRVRNELLKLGFKIGRRLIKRYMEEMDIVAFYPGLNLSKRVKMSKTHPYLLRHLSIKRRLYLMYPENVAEVKVITTRHQVKYIL